MLSAKLVAILSREEMSWAKVLALVQNSYYILLAFEKSGSNFLKCNLETHVMD